MANLPPPRGGRPLCCGGAEHFGLISIHALREEGDHKTWNVRDETKISIHALREEGDRSADKQRHTHWHFYPRPPRGGRRQPVLLRRRGAIFLSTPSARRATFSTHAAKGWQTSFLSTPSARRATPRPTERKDGTQYFYPRPPRGGRLKHSIIGW